MKFEEALKQMREGKKIRHPSFEDDIYFQACFVSLVGLEEALEEKKARSMSIVKMKGDRQHPDMQPTFKECMNPCKHGSTPQISIFLLMADNWDVIIEKLRELD